MTNQSRAMSEDSMPDPTATKKFDNLAGAYAEFRPSYPPEALHHIRNLTSDDLLRRRPDVARCRVRHGNLDPAVVCRLLRPRGGKTSVERPENLGDRTFRRHAARSRGSQPFAGD